MPLRLLGAEGEDLGTSEMVLVDAAEAHVPPAVELLTHDEVRDLERLHAVGAGTRTAADVGALTLSPASLGRAREVREALRAESDGDAAEQLLEELVAGEVAVGHHLQDIEAASAVLLGRVLTDPELALPTVRVAREIVALSTAVRTRTQNTLNAIAGLRAQRVLLAAQRGRRLGV